MERRKLKITLVAAVGAVFLYSCMSVSTPEQRRKEQPDVVLRAGKVYEECLPLAAPQVIDYYFSASKPLDFNIHYHSDKAFLPVEGEAVQVWKGVFDPTCIRNYSSEQPPFFCLMWTNRHDEEVELYYDFTIRDKE